MPHTGSVRAERDALGGVEVPAESLWGAQTQRAIGHFAISTERMPEALIEALALVKWGAARVNRELGLLDEARALAIIAAAEEVIGGQHRDAFPLSVWQSGSGTQTHMNLNEVLANRASEWLGGERGSGRRVHPNDHVNLGQSSNDVFPTAMHLAALRAVSEALLPAGRLLRGALATKSEQYADVIKVGRTHLQDAVPITLGQEFSGYVAQLDQALGVVESARAGLFQLALGGTAVGTGLNTHREFGARVAVLLGERLGLPLVSAPNKFAAIAGHEALVALHGGLRVLACALVKIANDLRWLASGPRAGLGEIRLPENEPGSSIMPGKVNPTQCEALIMACMQVFGNDVAIGAAGAAGNFELNACKPLIIHNLLQSLRLLADGMNSFARHSVSGIEADAVRMKSLVDRSLMLVTALTRNVGYDTAAQIALRAEREGITLREAAIATGAVSGVQFDQWVRPEAMV